MSESNGKPHTNGHTDRILIIGGGPCGLGAAWRTEEIRRQGNTHVDWKLVDSAADAGGLARTVVDKEGFLWDMGGHVIFSHYAYFSRLLDYLLPPEEWNMKIREAWVWMRGTFIPYPFQQNLHRLPKEEIMPCIEGLLEIEKKRHTFNKPAHFGEWLTQSFGTGLCNVFMTPYNKKVWAYDPSKMNIEWMGERVATVDTAKVIKNVIHQTDELGWGPNNIFRFPLHSGTGAIWTALYNKLPSQKFEFNKTVVAIDAKTKTVIYSDNTTDQYDSLISTIPMDHLITLTTNLNTPLAQRKHAATQFKHSSSHIIGIGLKGSPPAHLATKCWLYFPEDDCPFYRATVFSNYSENLCPKPKEQWSLMCEVSESPDKSVDIDNIIAITEQGLRNTKLISDTDTILSRFHIRLEYGYPTPFVGRDALLNPLHTDLESHNIYSRGRFGTWKYEVSNQDHSMMLGVECVDRIVFGVEELTNKYASIVNGKRDNEGRIPFLPK